MLNFELTHMGKTIRVRKGLNINLKGKAEKQIHETAISSIYSIIPSNFPGLVPKLELNEGDKVKIGTIIFHDKNNEQIKYVSPISGTLKEVVRGAKRKILSINIEADQSKDFEKIDVSGNPKEVILRSGLWPLIKQRPLDKVANPNKNPKAVFITGLDSHPLAPDFEFILKGKEKELQKGIDVLKEITNAKIHVTVEHNNKSTGVFSKINQAEIHSITGKHPIGNVGTQIHYIDPINKGETVWTLNAIDLAKIGQLFLEGKVDFTRTVAITGSEVKKPAYYNIIAGANLSSVLQDNIASDNVRVISGNVLTGTTVGASGTLGFYDNQITIIPEGNHYKFFVTEGWLSPGLNKLSNNAIYPTGNWLLKDTLFKNKQFDVDTNTNGEERAFVVSGEYEKVFPWNIYPVYLLKSIITNDIDGMENLGIYEVAPEDFALCEFVCTSKINSQKIVREGLEVIEKECM